MTSKINPFSRSGHSGGQPSKISISVKRKDNQKKNYISVAPMSL